MAMNRDEFMELVYDTLEDRPDNCDANRIIDAFDECLSTSINETRQALRAILTDAELHQLPTQPINQSQTHQPSAQIHQPDEQAQSQGGPIGPILGRNAQGEPLVINLPASGNGGVDLQPNSINLSERVRDKFEALKAMDTLAKAVNDESFYYGRWIELIPDEADDEELLEIAQEDDETFSDAVRCFINYFSEYAQEGGLYIGGERWPD